MIKHFGSRQELVIELRRWANALECMSDDAVSGEIHIFPSEGSVSKTYLFQGASLSGLRSSITDEVKRRTELPVQAGGG